MYWNRIKWIMVASCGALIVLVWLQFRWLQHSKELLEEQFDHKVSMAMCSAVETMAQNQNGIPVDSCAKHQRPNCCRNDSDSRDLLHDPSLESALNQALAFYQIRLPYQVSIIDKDSLADSTLMPPYACSLNPLLSDDEQLLNLTFPTKVDFLLKQMRFMLGSSIFIVLAISLIFLAANYYLIQQKKLSERNLDFFNNMAHEFKTPLTNITLASRMLGRKQPELADNQFLAVIHREGQHLLQQVDRVLHLASFDHNQQTLQNEPLHLGALIQEVVTDMAPSIREKKATISVELDPDLPLINGDRLHLSNAFRNLIDNALKYCTAAPDLQIRVNTSPTPGNIQVVLEDNGIGISEHDLPHVFEKFQRVGQSAAAGFDGFGLGLAYVKKIVELHRGAIQVASQLQQGTRFSLTFPTA